MSLQPPDHLTDEQVTYWKELVNRVHAAVEATDTPSEPTLEQVEWLSEQAVAEDPDVGFDELPDGWDASTVAEVWTKVGGSFTACKTKFVTEEGWSETKANKFCATLKDEVKNRETWREGGGLAAESPPESPFAMIPTVPDSPSRITRDMLEKIVRWKVARLRDRAKTGASLPPLRESLAAAGGDWNPALHPRDPETGKFVERPWGGFPDFDPEDISNMETQRLVRFLVETPGGPDMDAVLSSDDITIDGIPADIDSGRDLRRRLNNPTRNADIPTNPRSFGELNEGDVIRTPDGPAEIVTKGQGDGQLLTVRRPSGETEVFDVGEYRRNTVDVYDVDSLSALPSENKEPGDIPDLPPGIEGHRQVPQSVVDPGFTEEKVEQFKEAVDDGRISLGSGPFKYDGPFGIDKGMAALSIDMLEQADAPTQAGNLMSYGGYSELQPYLSIETRDTELLKDAAKRIENRLPEGPYSAVVTDNTASDETAIRIKNTEESFPAKEEQLENDAKRRYPDLSEDEAVAKYAKNTDVVEKYDLPTNEERAAIDHAFISGIRAALGQQSAPEPTDEPDERTLDNLTIDDVSPDNPDFNTNEHGASVGDFVRVDPGGLGADRDEPFIGKVTDRRYKGAEYTVETKDGDEVDVGAGEPRSVEGYLPAEPSEEPGWTELDVSDPDGGQWVEPSDVPSEGDIVRFNGPRSMEFQIGKAVSDMEGGTIELELPSGEVVEAGMGTDRELEGVFREDTSIDPTNIPTTDDVETRDLTEMTGTPAERREALRGEFAGDIAKESVQNEEIPEGVVLAKDRNTDTPFKYEVLGYEDTVTGTELKIQSEKGRTRTISPRIANERYKFWKPGDRATVTIPDNEWGDGDTPLSQRKAAVRSVLDDVVATADGDPRNSDDTLDEATFDKAKDAVAEVLARANDKEHAEQVAATLTSIGQSGRAHAIIEQSVFGQTTAWFSVDNDEDDDVIVHELGHAVGDVYDMRGGANDMDGNTHPMTDFAWQSPNYSVPQKYGMKTPPWHDDFEDGKSTSEQPSYGLDNWKDTVDEQVGTGLDGRNFTTPESSEDIPSEPGGMIRVEKDIGFDEPRIWRITEVDEDAGFDDEFDVELESRDGKTAGGRVKNQFGEPRIEFDNIGKLTGNEIVGKRNSTPDNWKENPPDPDDWLGTNSFDNADDAVHDLGEKVNKAWYRQAAATREHGGRQASDYSILGGYSSKQAHETMSRIHHVMTPLTADTGRKVKDEKRAEAARALVKYHPDLLEAYRNVYEIPPGMKNYLNAVLEREGTDFRFDAPSGTPPGGGQSPKDVVDDLYGGKD